jgi:hypothetical protein
LTTPIGPPPVKAAMPVAAGPLGPGSWPAASRDAAGRPRAGFTEQIRKGRLKYKFDSAAPAIRIGGAVQLDVESATSPSRHSAPARAGPSSRGCV